MGCDIHLFVEARAEDGTWTKAGRVFPLPDRYGEHLDTPRLSDEPWDGRDYDLFAILADVRNSGGLLPIRAPRGVPPDASDGYRHEVEAWGYDGHSHTFFTLAELDAFDWARFGHARHEAERTYRDLAGQGWFDALARVRATFPNLSPDAIRLVMFFDN